MDNNINSIGRIISESPGWDSLDKRIDDLGNHIRKHNQNDIGTYDMNSPPPLRKDINDKCEVIVGKQSSGSSSLSSSPNDDTIYKSDHKNEAESMGLSEPSDLPGCSKKVTSSCGEEDDDPSKHILCAWCQKAGSKVFSLQTTNGFKAFCSELCFAQCRRASFKKNKVCDWCKHVRHTVNYVDYQNGQQALQFCSDKCLNQYKMNLFCRETRAHLKPFSAIYRSPSSPPNYPVEFNVSSSNGTCESDKNDSKEAELSSINGHVILNENTNQKTVSSTSSPQSSSSLSISPPPGLKSDTSPTPSPGHSPNQITRSSFDECIKEACFDRPTLPTNNFHPTESPLINDTCIKLNQVKVKIVKKSKTKPVVKAITKQRKAQRDPTRDSNQENDLKVKRNTAGTTQVIVKTNSPALSTQSPPSLPRFSHNLPIHQQFENRPMEHVVNCPPPPQSTYDDSTSQMLRLPHFSRPPHLPHPSHHHPYIHPLRPEYMGFRQSFPLPIPFNQQNLFRVHGHHRPPFPPFPPVPIHHHSAFPEANLFHGPRASQSSIPLQFQPSQAVTPATSLPNNSYNYPDSSSSTPMPHPFLLPLPMPIPLPIPFPIKYDSSSNLKSVISMEDKEVQVGLNENTPYPRFTPNHGQFNSSINNNVNLSKSLINSFGSDNQTRFRIDTLMHKLIDKRIRSMENSIDPDLISIDSDCNALDLKMGQSTSRPNLNSKISNDLHDVTCFLKSKRFKRDILSN